MTVRIDKKKEYASFGIAIIALLLSDWVGIYSLLQTPLEKLIAPVMAVQHRAYAVMSWPLNQVSVSFDKSERIRDLETKYSTALAQLVELEQLRKENQELHQLLETKTSRGVVVTAPILSVSHPAIQAGEAQGIEQGNVVLIHQTLVGLVSQVSKQQSQVVLLSNPSITPILVQTDSGVRGVVRGDGKQVVLREIPKGAVVTQGEKVRTIGQQGIEPNILVGTIRSVSSKPEAPVQTAVIEQLVSFYEAVVVEVR